MKTRLLALLSMLAPPLGVISCAASAVVSQETVGSVALEPNHVIWLGQGAVRELVPVYIRDLRRSEVLGVSLEVRIDGHEVTSGVSSAHETPIDMLGTTSRSGLRLDLFTIDLSSLSLSPGQRVEYRASVTGANLQLIDTETADVAMSQAPLAPPPEQPCVDAFLNALGASQPANGGTTKFTAGLTCDQVRNAVQQLRNCLAALEPPVTSLNNRTFSYTDVNGNTLEVKIDLKANGSGTSASQTSTTSDVVIAVGGDADPSGTGAGGTATATASKSGAASVAVGGTGGGNGANPGNGGKGTASSSSSSGGDSYGLGDHGGNGNASGGTGADGQGTTNNTSATGFGQGGSGGDPIDNAKKGGKGGNGTGSRGTTGTSVTGLGAGQVGGNTFNAGQHGEGGAGRSETSGQSGYNGVSLTNQ